MRLISAPSPSTPLTPQRPPPPQPKVLQQEGWHLELEDPKEPLTYKGVVYNEMKGVYSSPDQIMNRVTQNVRIGGGDGLYLIIVVCVGPLYLSLCV